MFILFDTLIENELNIECLHTIMFSLVNSEINRELHDDNKIDATLNQFQIVMMSIVVCRVTECRLLFLTWR